MISNLQPKLFGWAETFVEHFTKSKRKFVGNDDFTFHDKKKVSTFKPVKRRRMVGENALKFCFKY
jgi:hypothetical protein